MILLTKQIDSQEKLVPINEKRNLKLETFRIKVLIRKFELKEVKNNLI